MSAVQLFLIHFLKILSTIFHMYLNFSLAKLQIVIVATSLHHHVGVGFFILIALEQNN
jgi:hypothetical protein